MRRRCLLFLLGLPVFGCGPDAVRGELGTAVLTVCSELGGSQVLVAEDPEAFPEGALLENGCATFELTPGTWYVKVSELTCEGEWEAVEVVAPTTEHDVDFTGCLG